MNKEKRYKVYKLLKTILAFDPKWSVDFAERDLKISVYYDEGLYYIWREAASRKEIISNIKDTLSSAQNGAYSVDICERVKIFADAVLPALHNQDYTCFA